MAVLQSVHVATPTEQAFTPRPRTTAIGKHPVDGPVAAGPLGLEGDEVADTRHHGGRDQAVYAYAREDLDFWVEQLGVPIPDGTFGENLTTAGLDLNAAVVGTRWRIGEALFEVSSVRTPCNTFKSWMALNGYDDTRWVKRFTQARRPGPYLRVLEEGEIRAGDAIRTEHVPGHGITVVDMFEALNLDQSRLPELDAVEDLAAEPRRKLAALRAREAAN